MSIVRCPECGNSVSDKADACPNCGYPVSFRCVIHIKWDNIKGNTFLNTGVCVDGTFFKDMKCSETLDCGVKPGAHRIDLYFRDKCVISENIDIQFGQTDAYIAFRQTLTGLKLVDPNSIKWGSGKKSACMPKCPTCGSTNIKRISMTRKAVSASVFGVASGSILKTFECKDCKYKW